MIRALLRVSLRQHVATIVLAFVAMLAGIRVALDVPIDAFPELAPPRVEIQTETPGLSSLEVEGLVTHPLEQALIGVPSSTTVRSKSVLGLSSVVVLFEPGTDLFRARQLVQERVATAVPQLPTLARAPVIMPPKSSTSRVLKVGLSSSSLSMIELSELARWTVRPRLMAIPGVANVAVWGERTRELQILVAPDRLRAHGLGLADIGRAATAAVSPVTGGFVDGPNQRMAVTHGAVVDEPHELAGAPVASRGGATLRIGDVAEVVEDHAPLIGEAVIDGGPGILLIVEKQPWGSTVAVTRAVDEALAELAPALPGVHVDATIFRPAGFIERSVANLELALGLGCVLVVLVLAAFLRDWRSAIISTLAIPLSLLAAVVVLASTGMTLDTMVLAGLAIALGEVVDDAIIDVENIHRRLRENAAAGAPRRPFAVVLAASLEVRSAVVYASVIVVLVFVPVYLLGGLAGALFRPLALAYAVAIVCSLFVALTVTPALALWLMPRAAGHARASALGGVLGRGLAPLLRAALARPRRVIALAVLALVVAVGGVTRLRSAFLPDFREQDFLMHWIAKPGASVDALRRTALRVSNELLAVPGVRNVGAHLGRAQVADEVVGPNFGELWVSVEPSADHAETIARIEATLRPYVGIYSDVQTYLREIVDEVLTGSHGALVVRIYGHDLAVLEQRAHVLADALRTIPGTHGVAVEALAPVPQIEVNPRVAAAELFGLGPGEIRAQVTTLVQGARIGEVVHDLRPIAVRLWGVPGVRDDVTSLRELRIATPDGGDVRLGDIADVYVAATPGALVHEGASRRIDVTCDVDDGALAEVAAAITTAIAGLDMPVGHHAELLGEHAAQQAATRTLAIGGALVVLGIVLVLYVDFRSLRLTLVVAASLPLALVGAVAAASLGSGVLSLGSLVGFVTVLGIAARNGIMLVDHYRRLAHEGAPFGVELIVRGTLERLTPILMTASCAGLALVPLALWGDRPGHEIEHPMAIVILGGLVTSTLLNLVVTPALYLRFGAGVVPHDVDEDEP